MDSIMKLSFREKEQLCMHLGKMYRNGRFQTTMVLYGMVAECGSEGADIDIASRIRLILMRMDQRYALIILNDFLEIKGSGWWKSQFSRSTYYRYKKLAVEALLAQLYMETV